MIGQMEILADPPALARRTAEWMTAAAEEASEGVFRVALAGGSTPESLYRLLAADGFRRRFPWRRVHWFWGDERFVPHRHPASNFGMARRAMLARVPAPAEHIHPMPVDGTPEAAAGRYERTLRAAYGREVLDPDRPLFDLTLLGLGADGHTASLLPGQPVLDERRRWVAAVSRGRPEPRLTLTYPALESSRRVGFLVSGSGKAAILAAIRAGGTEAPAARLRPVGEVVWFADRAAAGRKA